MDINETKFGQEIRINKLQITKKFEQVRKKEHAPVKGKDDRD